VRPRERHEKAFDASPQITRVDVQDAHARLVP
jgi:hypothetical protein